MFKILRRGTEHTYYKGQKHKIQKPQKCKSKANCAEEK